MNAALMIAGLLLAAVLATAGIAKLLDLEGSRRAVAAFGVPSRLAGPLGTLLPAAELVTGALLVAGALSSVPAQVGGLAALVLLAAFSAAIAASLARGRAPDCHCFGQLHSSPAGPWTLARNGALLALATFVASGGEPLATAVAAATALAMLAFVVLRPRATERDQPPDAEGLPPGTPAPGFQLPDMAGRVHTLDSLRAGGRPLLLLFSDPGCGPCMELAPEVARWQRDHADELTIAVVERERDRDGHDPTSADEYGRRNILLQRESEVAELYGALGTPTGVLIDRDGAIAGPVAAGSAQIEAVVAAAVDGLALTALTVRRVLAPPLRRRELLARGAGAWAAMGVVAAWPIRAVAGVSRGGSRAAKPCETDSECASASDNREECRAGRCRCREGLNRVNGVCRCDRGTFCSTFGFHACVDVQSDPSFCGSCDNDCFDRGYNDCCDGKCADSGQSRCSCGPNFVHCDAESVCAIDEAGVIACFNCSQVGLRRCGNECGDPEQDVCCDGVLHRGADLGPGDWKCCGPKGKRRVVNVDASASDCGGCDHRCPPDKPLCYRGKCRDRCPRRRRRCGDTCGNPKKQVCCERKLYPKDSGIRNCKDRCTDTRGDPKNCGDCGVKCSGPFDTGECCNGSCCDINGDTCCPGGCTNVSLNDENCGACGNACKPGEFCRFGVCTCPLGQTCG